MMKIPHTNDSAVFLSRLDFMDMCVHGSRCVLKSRSGTKEMDEGFHRIFVFNKTVFRASVKRADIRDMKGFGEILYQGRNLHFANAVADSRLVVEDLVRELEREVV